MANTLKINGVTYNDVKAVQMPLAMDTSKLISYMDTTDADATAEQIKNGSSAYVKGVKVTGTMPANGAIDKTLDANTTSYTIPKGYTDGGSVDIVPENKTATPTKSTQNITPADGKVLSKVTVNPIPDAYQDVTGVTATTENVLDGSYFVTAAGELVEGTMPDNGTVNASIDGLTTTSYTIPAGKHSGSGKVSLTGDIENALAAI
jgi:hypothetical protein